MNDIKCQWCTKFFSNKTSMGIHVMTYHLNYKFFRCHLCDNIFTQKFLYNQHMRTHTNPNKSNVKLYSCVDCDKQFSYRNTYARHLKKVHATTIQAVDPITYRCKVCNKFYSYRIHYLQHMKKH